MKQITQNYKSGLIRLEEVEPPALKPGGILVRSRYSVVSAGTEGMKVREGKLSYLGKARARPDQVKKVLESVRQQGVAATYQKVMNKLDSLTPLGYSMAGEVLAVGAGAEEFQVGQTVACAGAGYANHAEIDFVPLNLAVPVPAGVSLRDASYATVGAIALQGFRQAEMQLGESACVIGLGLLGQILVQILGAAGMHVVGVDLVRSRCELAVSLGAALAATPDDPALLAGVERLTGGLGVDRVFLVAAGSSNGPVELAVQLARDRGRVVDIGKSRLDLPWNDYYMKELDVRFSRSYGPGRYDPAYEEGGMDYPAGYVRWTERRNLSSFLDLVASGRVRLEPLTSSVRPFCEAEQVYETLASGGDALGTVFEYPAPATAPAPAPLPRATAAPRAAGGRLRVGAIGAGNYASSMLLPHLQKDEGVELAWVATATSLSAENARRKFGFAQATTDHRRLLDDPGVDAVLVSTRHATHPRFVAEALRAGKAVFVEKPLAIDEEGLETVRRAVAESENDRLLVGFNRRFSPAVQGLARAFSGAHVPLVVHYRVHAGRLDARSWYLDPAEGSRFAGEAGHFLDVIALLTGARPVCVTATALRPERATRDDLENLAVTVQYADGSVGNLLYLTQGDISVPKEHVEVFGGGRTAQMENFRTLSVHEGGKRTVTRLGALDKGQPGEMAAWVQALRAGGAMPIPLESLLDTTRVTLAAVESLRTGAPVRL